MATLTSQLIVRLLDQVTGPAGRAAASLRGLQAAARSTGGVNAALATIQRSAGRFIDRAQTAGATIGAPAAVAAAAGYQTMVQFSRELNKATAIGELTREQAGQVERTARDVGRETQFTAMQALEMIRTLVAAGRTVDQARGMTRPILDAALFGDTDPKTAADGIVAITSAYRMQMRTVEEARAAATRTGDVIAKAANLSRASFDDIMQGFKYAAPIANAAGWSMEQLAASIAHMSNNGLRGDEAGVAIRSMLVRMVKPTRDAHQAMAELGLSFQQFFGNMKEFNAGNFASGMANAGHRLSAAQRDRVAGAVRANAALPTDQQRDLAQVLTDATIEALGIPQRRVQDRQKIARAVQLYANSLAESVNPDALFQALQERQATPGQMARIFDARQGSRLMALLGEGYGNILQEIQRSAAGASARGAAIMQEGLYGAHKRIQSAWENIVLTIGTEGGAMQAAASALTSVAQQLNSIAATNPQALTTVAKVLLGFALLAPVALVITGVSAAFGMITSAATGLLGALALVHAAMAKIGLVAAASSTGAAALGGGAVVATAAAGIAAGYVAGKVIDATFGQSRNFIPQDQGTRDDLVDQLRAKEAELARIRERTHPAMRNMPNPQASNLESEIQNLKNRIELGLRNAAGDMMQAGHTLGQEVPKGVAQSAAAARAAGAQLGTEVAAGLRAAMAGVTASARAAAGGGAGPVRPSVAGARAGGGPVSAGRTYAVGERGVELFTPDRNGSIIPNAGRRGAAAGGGGGSSQTINFSPTITVNGGQDEQALAKRIRAELEDAVQTAFRSIQADTGQSYAT